MKVVTVMKQGVLVIRLEGELDVCGANQFRAAVDKALDETGAKHILLNMQGVAFIDSSGLGVILGRYKRIDQFGGKMVIAHLEPQVQRIFELAGLMKIVTIYESEEEALELI
ncbi:anti-sigma F factor antagonist [Sporomusa malonica]|uniref:Anti-sigma F factor antagonist n=1 Tax=Sporomusa malonica TaxID=112901 RepID=A0A1W2ACJ0_9FIRM|nr:anti-sigma F factor antagonist [Sporomusa malonica]SMC58439.1 anti-anti-sigma regulatory factor, SpoIIAA [Sporomusa malonica]